MGSTSHVPSFNSFHGVVSEMQGSKIFLFSNMAATLITLQYKITSICMTFDIIIIKPFYMNSRTYVQNFVSFDI